MSPAASTRMAAAFRRSTCPATTRATRSIRSSRRSSTRILRSTDRNAQGNEMSERQRPKLPEGVLTDEQIARISGGECTVNDAITALGELQKSYDTLVDFTSYVIERVIGQ